MAKTENPSKKESPYVFRSGAAGPAREIAPGVMGREAKMLGGIMLRYQERQPGPPSADWCLSGHSIFMLGGRLRLEFADHAVELGAGDMAHIPAGHAHRHRPQALGAEAARYYVTEFA
jgi:Cupin domain